MSSPPLIQRYGQQRSLTVTSFVESGFNSARLTRQVMERLEG